MKSNAEHTVYLSLGSNLGDRLQNLRAARQGLAVEVQVSDCSPVYSTPPWGVTDQPEFLNQVVVGSTRLSPQMLLAFLKDLENHLGRKPSLRYGPRSIDMDILLYDDLVYETPALTIPHPRMSERAFVLVPLADLAPRLKHPVLHMEMQAMVQKMDTHAIQPYNPASSDNCSD